MSTPAPPPEKEHRLATRLLALLVIIAGLALVVYVFLAAKQLFESPALTLPKATPSPKPLPGASPDPTNALGDGVVRGVVVPLADSIRRLLALLVMCIAGSIIAALGIRWWGKR